MNDCDLDGQLFQFLLRRPCAHEQDSKMPALCDGNLSDVEPVDVVDEDAKKRAGEKQRKKHGKGKKSSKKAKTCETGGTDPTPESKAEVLETFLEAYRPVIQKLPVCLWPTSSKHGQHSYTVFLGQPK